MIKVILFDADGCTLVRHKYFSEIYSEKYNVPLEKITPFFKEKFGRCQTGKADLKIEIESYLKEWGWQGSVEDFLNFWFTSDIEPDTKTLSVVKELREKGIFCYLATNQEKYRLEAIRNTSDFAGYFDGILCSCEIGHRKPDEKFFKSIISLLNVQPSEILFWDNEQPNVESAKNLGFHAEKYTSLEDFQEKLKNYFV